MLLVANKAVKVLFLQMIVKCINIEEAERCTWASQNKLQRSESKVLHYASQCFSESRCRHNCLATLEILTLFAFSTRIELADRVRLRDRRSLVLVALVDVPDKARGRVRFLLTTKALSMFQADLAEVFAVNLLHVLFHFILTLKLPVTPWADVWVEQVRDPVQQMTQK